MENIYEVKSPLFASAELSVEYGPKIVALAIVSLNQHWPGILDVKISQLCLVATYFGQWHEQDLLRFENFIIDLRNMMTYDLLRAGLDCPELFINSSGQCEHQSNNTGHCVVCIRISLPLLRMTNSTQHHQIILSQMDCMHKKIALKSRSILQYKYDIMIFVLHVMCQLMGILLPPNRDLYFAITHPSTLAEIGFFGHLDASGCKNSKIANMILICNTLFGPMYACDTI